MKITPIQLAKRVQYWQEQLGWLGIAHFSIDSVNISSEIPVAASSKAAVTMPVKYDHCTFWFSHETLDESTKEELDEIIVHEWVHVAFRDFEAALHPVERWMPEATYEDWRDRIEHEEEGVVDRFARQIIALHDK